MEDAGQKLGNGSMTLLNEEETAGGDRSSMWARLGRRQLSDSGYDDMSMAASPSRRKEQIEVRDISIVGKLTGRDSQQGLMAAIISITNVSTFFFPF